MREILFRAKSVSNGEWIYSMTIGYGTIKRKSRLLYLQVDDIKWKQGVPETLGQFTGLTDVKGKQVFEGDLIRIDHSQHNGRRFVVGYDKHKCAFDFKWAYNGGGMQLLATDINYPIEVTGSIHSNETA